MSSGVRVKMATAVSAPLPMFEVEDCGGLSLSTQSAPSNGIGRLLILGAVCDQSSTRTRCLHCGTRAVDLAARFKARSLDQRMVERYIH